MDKKLFLAVCCIISAATTNSISQDIIFLHHSTGSGVYKEGNVAGWFEDYNAASNTNYTITERSFPESPYPWANYPYDYWNLWLNNTCDNDDRDISCLSGLCANYDVIVFKHCYPGSRIKEDSVPDITSSVKTLSNYKLQYRALRDLMDSYPDNKFIVWTLAPLNRLNTDAQTAARSREFVDWVKNEWLTEDGKGHPNIFIFDFFGYVAESDPTPENGMVNSLRYDYEIDHGSGNSHPNTLANETVGPLFAQFIVNTIEEQQAIQVADIAVTGEEGENTITIPGGTLQLNAVISPEDATIKEVTWSVVNGTGAATISSSGLVTAVANGTVTASATANDGSGISGSLVITITGETVMVFTIEVYGDDLATTISTPGGTLQLFASILPEDATNKSVTWSLQPGTGMAEISPEGLLTAVADGNVTAKATANDGSEVSGNMEVEIENQLVPTGIGEAGEEPFVVRTLGTEIHIEFTNPSGYDQIRLYDLHGNLVLTKKLSDTPYKISISPLAPGMYIMQVVARDGKMEGVRVNRL